MQLWVQGIININLSLLIPLKRLTKNKEVTDLMFVLCCVCVVCEVIE